MQSDDSSLIPELAKWNGGAGITMEAWMSCIGRYDHALGYTAIFWPNFVQHESCIFRTKPDPAVYREWMKTTAGDSMRVEAVMNHVHLADLFNDSNYEPDKPLLVRLGELLAEMWSCKLARDFPARRFETRLTSDVEDLLHIEPTFFQIPQQIFPTESTLICG